MSHANARLTLAGVDAGSAARGGTPQAYVAAQISLAQERSRNGGIAGSLKATLGSWIGLLSLIRMLTVARRSAVKACAVAANQIDAVVVTAVEHLKESLRHLTTAARVRACTRVRPPTTTVTP